MVVLRSVSLENMYLGVLGDLTAQAKTRDREGKGSPPRQ